MAAPALSLVLLFVSCFSLATWIGPRFTALSSNRDKGFLAGIMGESRRLFANQFFVQSDVYFHSGYYPGIFDQAGNDRENHLATGAGAQEKAHDKHEEEKGHVHDEHCEHGGEHDFLGAPKDFMDAFTRHFFVSEHTHLDEKGTNAPREILPWLKLATELDPSKVESYTVGAYWLRQLQKNDEAEEFLREGFRHNPQSYEIAFELGRSYFDKKDFVRGRNLWELAMRRWREQENPKPDEQKNRFMAAQILLHLARLEVLDGNREQSIAWLGILKKISPFPEQVQRRIDEVRAGQTLEIER